MDQPDFASLLRRCRAERADFTPAALAEFFKIDVPHFHQTEPRGAIVFHPGGDRGINSFLLRGAIFWPQTRQIVRGHPRIPPTSDYTGERFQILQEPIFAQAAFGGEVVAEPKLFGETIRVYTHHGDLYCATDVSHDGGNPLVGAGIDDSRALGIDYGSQAARLLERRCPKIERLTRLGYTAVFVLQLPELAPDHSVDASDMILVDVIDPDLVFVDRLEKERIAEDYSLTVVDLIARITTPSAEIFPFLRRCRALEHQAAIPGSSGAIVKAQADDASDQIFCKVEPASERDRTREITSSDLAAITEEITGQFDPTVWSDDLFIEELMLEYLGTHHRTARWRVHEYLTSWRQARKAAGLG